jgi:Tfp pilus assembly protein PilZ
MYERRQYPRVFPPEIEVNFLNKAYMEFKNISAGGLCIIVNSSYSVDAMLNIFIRFPDSGYSLKTFCKVRWIKRIDGSYYKVGLEYWHILPEDREYIIGYIKNILKENIVSECMA